MSFGHQYLAHYPPTPFDLLSGLEELGLMSARPKDRALSPAKLNEKPLLALTMRLQWDGFAAGSHYRIDSMVEREGLVSRVPLP